jgi:hypothetical protein
MMASPTRAFAYFADEFANVDPFFAPDERFHTLERYWSEPAFRAQLAEEQAQRRAEINEQLDAVRDRDLRRLGYL